MEIVDLRFVDIFTNPIVMVPTCTWLLAQILKCIINALVNKTVNFSRLWGDGGMPSAHSATVVSTAGMCAIYMGFASPLFALSAILAIIVMHDATGVRRESGKHAVAIKSMIEVINDYFAEKDVEIKTEKLKVLIGHTHLQVVFGALLGFVTTLVYYFIAR